MKAKFSLRLSIWACALGAIFATGCSVDGSITDTTKRTTKPTSSQLTGIAAGSMHTVTTDSGYTISSSVGSPYGGEIVTTTPEGYTVYSSLQGNMNAETQQVLVE